MPQIRIWTYLWDHQSAHDRSILVLTQSKEKLTDQALGNTGMRGALGVAVEHLWIFCLGHCHPKDPPLVTFLPWIILLTVPILGDRLLCLTCIRSSPLVGTEGRVSGLTSTTGHVGWKKGSYPKEKAM